MDTLAFASAFDAAQDLAKDVGTPRVTPPEIARILLDDAARARNAADVAVDPNDAEARDVVRECVALADFAEYYAHKLRAATALAVYEASASDDFLGVARDETALADAAWVSLANDTAYIAPFVDMMTIGHAFHWRDLVPSLSMDPRSIDDAVAQVKASPPPPVAVPLPSAGAWLDAPRAEGPGLVSLDVSPSDPTAPSWTVRATFARAVPADAAVTIEWKEFPSSSDWTNVAASGSGTTWEATVTHAGDGGMFAVEVRGRAGVGWHYPDPLTETPYVVLVPR